MALDPEELHGPDKIETGIPEHTVRAVLTVAGLHERQKVTLDGVDISRFVNAVDISARPGELTQVQLGILANPDDHISPAVELPEQLCLVTVVDQSEYIELRNMIREALSRLEDEYAERPLTEGETVLTTRMRRAIAPETDESLGSYTKRRYRRE